MGLPNFIKDDIRRQAQSKVRQRFTQTPKGCVNLDKEIKKIGIEIADVRRKVLTESNSVKRLILIYTAETLEAVRDEWQSVFIDDNCTFQLEQLKAQETAKIIGEEVQKYEDDVLSGSSKESKNLFVIGGGLLLVATGIILYFTTRKK